MLMETDSTGGDMRPLTWVQVCHAGVAVTRGCAVIIAGLRFPEGCPGARRPVTVPLVFLPLPLVQEAGRHVLHTLLLTLFIWETGQDRPGSLPVSLSSRPLCPRHCVQTGDGTEMPSAQSLPGEEGGQWGYGLRGKMVQVSLEHLLWRQPGSRKQRLGGHRGAWGSTAAWPGSRASLSPGGD